MRVTTKTIPLSLPRVIGEKLTEYCRLKNISQSGVIRNLILQELIKANLLTVEELIANQMTEQGFREPVGPKRKKTKTKPKTKTLLE